MVCGVISFRCCFLCFNFSDTSKAQKLIRAFSGTTSFINCYDVRIDDTDYWVAEEHVRFPSELFMELLFRMRMEKHPFTKTMQRVTSR